MKIDNILSVAMMFQSFCASAIYAYSGEWWKSLYWLSGSLITYAVLRM